jgi:hypothetical protein
MKRLAKRFLLTHGLLSIFWLVIARDSSAVFAGGAPDAAKAPPFKMTLKDGKLSAQIRTAALRSVIMEISRLTGAEVRWLSQEEEDPVSAEFTDRPLHEVLERILKKNFTLSYTFVGNDKKLIGIWIASRGGRSEPAPTPDATNSLSMVQERHAENAPGWDRTRARKDPKVRVEREEWPGEPLPVEPVAEINLTEQPPSVRLQAVEVLAMDAEKDQEARMILSHLTHNDSDPQVREMASRVLEGMKRERTLERSESGESPPAQ